MSHIVFIDSNFSGIDAMHRAKVAGHEVSIVLSEGLMLYRMDDATRRVLAGADRVLWIDRTTDSAELVDALRRIRTGSPIDAVVSQLEYCVEPLARACAELGLRYTSADAVHLARNKHLCRARLQEARIPSARFAVAHTVGEAVERFRSVGAPAVVKPTGGGDSLLAAVVEDEDGLRRAAARVLDGVASLPATLREQFSRGILVEERLEGDLVSVEVGVVDGQILHYMISGRYRSGVDEVVELGSFMPARLGDSVWRACEEYGVSVCRALGLDLGIFHLEVIVTRQGPRLVEANPRLMGGALPILYERFTGHNIHDHLIALHLGRPLPVPVRPVGGVASTHKLIAARDGAVASDVKLDWLADHEPHIVYLDTGEFRPGRQCTAGETLGRFQLVHQGHDALDQLAETVVAGFEAALGLPLMR